MSTCIFFPNIFFELKVSSTKIDQTETVRFYKQPDHYAFVAINHLGGFVMVCALKNAHRKLSQAVIGLLLR